MILAGFNRDPCRRRSKVSIGRRMGGVLGKIKGDNEVIQIHRDLGSHQRFIACEGFESAVDARSDKRICAMPLGVGLLILPAVPKRVSPVFWRLAGIAYRASCSRSLRFKFMAIIRHVRLSPCALRWVIEISCGCKVSRSEQRADLSFASHRGCPRPLVHSGKMESPRTPSLTLEELDGLNGESKEKSSDIMWESSNPGKAMDWDGRAPPCPPCIPSIIDGEEERGKTIRIKAAGVIKRWVEMKFPRTRRKRDPCRKLIGCSQARRLASAKDRG